ncbi:Hybrid peroxiredoxin hyPrx5 [Myxococcaceae bacterium]|jgi:peroxiredoxin|nr:Hybrid peroxiredoxin hyPrx5 [Myxococcaceae bacterium]
MPIEVGQKVPDVKLKAAARDGIRDVSTRELFAGKRSVLFGVPGAFTPTCSARHLPGFVEKAAELRAKGIDQLVCVSVNDAFVMEAWGRERAPGGEVLLLADGNAAFTEALGLGLDATGFGMGRRCQRFAALVEDGVVTRLRVEQPGKFEVSSADAILGEL